jgi:hypothetical protein
VGVVGFLPVDNDQSLNRPGLDTDDINKALAALNSALQTIQKFGPQDLKYIETAAFYNDPVQVGLSVVVLNGQSATATTTPPAWMLGCSILISGDSDFNRIIDITGNSLSLLRGYRGPSGTATATVYADCALLSPTIGAVLEPVFASQSDGISNLLSTQHRRMRPARDLSDFYRYQRFLATQATPGNLVGRPEMYYVERRRQGDIFLRITPMPGAGVNATFQAKLRAERVDGSIINTTTGVDPGYEFVSLHPDEVESLLLPIARWRFFTHPALKNAETRTAVKEEYDETMVALRNGAVFETKVIRERVTYI